MMVRKFRFNFSNNGIEQWLQKMAAQGLILRKFGVFVSTFEKVSPVPFRYHIEPVYPPTNRERITALDALGWKLGNAFGIYNVFFTDSSEAPVPEPQAIPEPVLDEKSYISRMKFQKIAVIIFAALSLATILYTVLSYYRDMKMALVSSNYLWAFIFASQAISFWINSHRKIQMVDDIKKPEKVKWNKVLFLVFYCLVVVSLFSLSLIFQPVFTFDTERPPTQEDKSFLITAEEFYPEGQYIRTKANELSARKSDYNENYISFDDVADTNNNGFAFHISIKYFRSYSDWGAQSDYNRWLDEDMKEIPDAGRYGFDRLRINSDNTYYFAIKGNIICSLYFDTEYERDLPDFKNTYIDLDRILTLLSEKFRNFERLKNV